MNKIVVLALLAMVSSPAFAVIPAQVLNVSMTGSITANCYYYIQPAVGGAQTNSVAAGGATPTGNINLAMAALKENIIGATVYCNDSAGYTFSASSTNGGLLKSGANSIPYTLQMNTDPVTTITTTPAILYTRSAGAAVENGNGKSIYITYPSIPTAAGSTYPSGTYTDTVLLSMQAN